MEDRVKRMVEEHKALVEKIVKLNDFVYSEKSDKVDKIEFANCTIQLSAMKKYAEALQARLFNVGIIYEDGSYLQHIA